MKTKLIPWTTANKLIDYIDAFLKDGYIVISLTRVSSFKNGLEDVSYATYLLIYKDS